MGFITLTWWPFGLAFSVPLLGLLGLPGSAAVRVVRLEEIVELGGGVKWGWNLYLLVIPCMYPFRLLRLVSHTYTTIRNISGMFTTETDWKTLNQFKSIEAIKSLKICGCLLRRQFWVGRVSELNRKIKVELFHDIHGWQQQWNTFAFLGGRDRAR